MSSRGCTAVSEEGINDALLESGQKAEALSVFQQLAQDDPANLAVRFGLAAALMETGSTEESTRILEDLKARDPDDVATRAYLARAYLLLGAAPRARNELAAARSLSPYSDLLHAQLVEWCYQSGYPDIAREQIAYFHTLSTSAELRGRVRYLEGLLAYQQGRLSEAVAALERAVDDSPRHEAHWSALLTAQGSSDIAAVDQASLGEALRRFPESPALLSLFALREIRFAARPRPRDRAAHSEERSTGSRSRLRPRAAGVGSAAIRGSRQRVAQGLAKAPAGSSRAP